MLKTTNFINKIKNYAIEDMRKNKINVSLTIAQAILESAWGTCDLSINANNLFGIKKGAWNGEIYTVYTKEFIDGQWITIQDHFRKYNNWGESIADHSKILLQDRYKSVINCKDYKQACINVYKSGYATDPNYPQKLIQLIEQYELYKYDNIENDNVSYNKGSGQAFVLCDILNIRKGPSVISDILDTYSKDESFYYDSVYENDGYIWVSYIARSGKRVYVASRSINNSEIYLKCI